MRLQDLTHRLNRLFDKDGQPPPDIDKIGYL